MDEKYYLYVSLNDWKNNNNPAAWHTLRTAVAPRYQRGLTDENLSITFSGGGWVEICFEDNPNGHMEKAISELASRFPGRYVLKTDKK